MARPLASRVARLERSRSPACPACGLGGPGPATYAVTVPEATGRVPTAHTAWPPERCAKCGRPRVFWVSMLAARADG